MLYYVIIGFVVGVVALVLGVRHAIDDAYDNEDLLMYIVIVLVLSCAAIFVWPIAVIAWAIYLVARRYRGRTRG